MWITYKYTPLYSRNQLLCSLNMSIESFTNTITADGEFTPENDRYHLYLGLAGPWAHRAAIVHKLKGLDKFIPTSIVHWQFDNGWKFPSDEEIKSTKNYQIGTPDNVFGLDQLRDVYSKIEPNYTGRITVPILYDTKTKKIVNNESAEIIRIFNTAFNSLLDDDLAQIDLYPTAHRKEIDEINAWVLENLTEGVYNAGLATEQDVYEKETNNVFDHLDKVEGILKKQADNNSKYLVGDTLTEADVRLYTTLIRFDPIYYLIFKLNKSTIREGYPHTNAWLKNLYWKVPGFKETTSFDHIKLHYAKSHKPAINPHGLVPVGPIDNIQPL